MSEHAMSEHTVENDARCRRWVTFPNGSEGECGDRMPCWRHPEQTRVIPPAVTTGEATPLPSEPEERS